MVVPYRDPSPDHYRRTAYDIGEWGLGLHDAVAGARLRLPGRDPLPRCRPARHARRAVRDPERRLHPRGGRRRALEARRPRARAPRSAARGGSSSPSTSPSPTTSTSSTGGSTRTARSSATSARPGSWSSATCPRARAAVHGTMVDQRTYAPFHQHFLIARLDMDVDGAGQHRPHGRDLAGRLLRGRPVRARAVAAPRSRCAPSPRAGRTTAGRPSAAGRSSTRRR